MMKQRLMLRIMKGQIVIAIITILFVFPFGKSEAQIWEPEGINIPGLWNTWTNPPVNALALASYTQVPGGLVTKITSGIPRWHTTIKVAATGGDVLGGSYPFLFTSGPSASPWQNTWKDVTVVMNTLQDYIYNGVGDNQITVVNGNWYTVNWWDNGYAPSKAIFMETSAAPVPITSVTQSPVSGQIPVGQDVTVTISLGSLPSAQELFYIRYSNNGFTTSQLIPIVMTGTSGTAIIPATTGTVNYYVFSTTVSNPTSDFDLYAIMVDNNGGSNYSYYYNTTITDVTFRVDMSLQTVSADGIHLVGDFQGWNTASTPMSHIGGGIYSVTLPLPSGSYQEYKFLNGNTYAGEETVPASCGTDNGSGGLNRYLTIPENDVVLQNVCFSSCAPCASMVSVTFSVDMSLQTVSPDGVYLVGDFQSWNTTATPMVMLADNFYVATVSIPANSYQEYKFLNGNTFAGEEIVPESCGADNGSGGFNRFCNVSETNMEIPAVCFSYCGACPPPPQPVNVTFKINMSEQTVSVNGVHIVGDFQGWDPDSTLMTPSGNNNYSVTLSLLSGSYHEFKFVNGSDWDSVEIVPIECGVDDGSGGNNRFVTLPYNDTILEAVCFSSCGPCINPPETSVVNFKVDMKDQVIASTGVHLTGNFQNWDPAGTPMSLIADGIYEVSVLLEEGYAAEYKFINGDSLASSEIVPEACGVADGSGGFNRFLTVPVEDTVTDANCFGECAICHLGLTEFLPSEIRVGKLRPNPVTDYCWIDFRCSDNLVVGTKVFNAIGNRVLQTENAFLSPGENHLVLDLSKLKAGMYFVTQEINRNGEIHTITHLLIKN